MQNDTTKYPDTFTLIWKRYISEVNSEAFYFKHNKTGAEVLVLENDDNNKVFGVSFKTIPEDHTGVAHILEHSVLAGSRKFKVKEPFVELIKTSVNTFVNAMTYPDKTIYPVASQNEQDLFNMMDVYLDAVFFPTLDENVFKQEGWHYEYDENGKLIIKGVVFNEMKGALSNPDSLLYNHIQSSIFPDNLYRYESGGDPEFIPELTYEQFKKFHKDHYHPSNSKSYFWGNGDTFKNLSYLDSYLKEFEKVNLDLKFEEQKPFSKPKHVVEKYPISKDSSLEKKSYTVKSWVLNDLKTQEERIALDILEYILVVSEASPLRKLLLDSGLGEDLFGGYDPNYLQHVFMLGLKGANESDLEKIEKIIDETLNNFSENIDKDLLESAINIIEFNLRENKHSRYPRGLALFTKILCNWNYDRDPLEIIKFEEEFKSIRNRLQKNEKYFENLIKKYILENTHSSTVRLNPDTNLLAQKEDKEKSLLLALDSKLSSEEKDNVKKDNEQFRNWQNSVDNPEELAKIPKLKISDLDKKPQELPIEIEKLNNVELIKHNLETNDIVYINIGFDIKNLQDNLLTYLQIYEDCLMRLGTSTHNVEELALLTDKRIGGLSTNIYLTNHSENKNNLISKFFIDAKVLKENFKDLIEIVSERLFQIDFNNKEKLFSMLQESKSGYESSFMGNGAARMGMNKAFASLSLVKNLSEKISGFSHYFFLKDLVENFESNYEELINNLKGIHEFILNRKDLVINITCNNLITEEIKPELSKFINSIPLKEISEKEFNFVPKTISEAYTIPSEVNYNSLAFDIEELGYKAHGSAYAISNIIYGSYLWNNVRVKGGAYGSSSSYSLKLPVFGFTSWRDPNIEKTWDTYLKASRYLKENQFTTHDLEGAILSSVGELDTYLHSDEKGWLAMDAYLTGTTDEKRQKRRDELLNFTINDIKDFGEVLSKLKNYSKVVVGNKKQIEEIKEKHNLEIKTLI